MLYSLPPLMCVRVDERHTTSHCPVFSSHYALYFFTTHSFLCFSVSNYCFINSIRGTIRRVIDQSAWGSGFLSSFITNIKPNREHERSRPWGRLHTWAAVPHLPNLSVSVLRVLFLSFLQPPPPRFPLPVISPSHWSLSPCVCLMSH